ncbi:MAG: T9SS type A sorting domain-containing protein [Brumimicrobium sp.]
MLSNRTYNYYTRGGCNVYTDTFTDAPNAGDTTFHKYRPKPPFLQSFGVAGPSSGDNALKLRNMKTANYQINYYSMNDPNLLIGSETQWGPQINLNFPPMNENNWIIPFTAHRTNINFKSADTTITDGDSDKTLQRSEEKSTERFQLYPNPANDQLYYSIEDCKKTNIIISNMVGQTIFETNNTGCSGQIDVSKLSKGTYTVTFETSSETIKKRIVIN